MRRDVLYLDAPQGGRFCLVTRPHGDSVGAILFVPPFAEELNKSRRMVALAARAFAAHGWTVLQLDPLGCGDSAGDFGDAGWQDWLDDLGRGYAWLRAETGLPPVLWSLRAGSLLAADWLQQNPARPPLLLWQPVTNGRQHLTQFLRLKAANEMLADADAKAAMAEVRAALQSGQAVEVAGYAIAPALAAGIEASALRLPKDSGPVGMIEVSGSETPAVSPVLQRLADAWQADGIPVRADVVPGPAFWQAQEIETAPALIERSLRVLDGFVR